MKQLYGESHIATLRYIIQTQSLILLPYTTWLAENQDYIPSISKSLIWSRLTIEFMIIRTPGELATYYIKGEGPESNFLKVRGLKFFFFRYLTLLNNNTYCWPDDPWSTDIILTVKSLISKCVSLSFGMVICKCIAYTM